MAKEHKSIKTTVRRFTKAHESSPVNQLWSRRGHNGGFTMLELLIIIAIIGTLCAIAIPAYNSYVKRASIKLVIEDIKSIDKQLKAFDFMKNRLPETLADAGIDMIDPWQNPYQYTLIRGKPLTGPGKVIPRKDKNLHPLNSDYDLCSMGPDGLSSPNLNNSRSIDDIIRAGDGSFYGVAEDY
jgi:general secretion pathway protein G